MTSQETQNKIKEMKKKIEEQIKNCVRYIYTMKLSDDPKYAEEQIEKETKLLLSIFQSEAEKREKEVAKAFGGCTKCYGKGYSTYRHGISGVEDFGGDGFERAPKTHMIYCSCDRGKQLEELKEHQK